MRNKKRREKILAFNREVKANKEKASDMEILISEIAKLPPGQFKKIATDEVIAIFAKYGIEIK